MAETDLDVVIRGIGKTQHKALMAEVKKRQARLASLSAKARASARSFVFTETVVDQWPGRQRWICSTAWRRTTLSLGAMLLMLDNSVTADDASVKKGRLSPWAASPTRR